MQPLVITVVVACLSGGLYAADKTGHKVTIGAYTMQVAKGWTVTQAKPKKPGIVAVRLVIRDKVKKQVAEILVAKLSGSVDEEWKEMSDSAKKQPKNFKVFDSGDLVTLAGVKGKQILLKLRAKDPDYGFPLVFHSIYLPQRDGTCVTFKLRCGTKYMTSLTKEFEAMVLKAARGK